MIQAGMEALADNCEASTAFQAKTVFQAMAARSSLLSREGRSQT
jgi:hypothetical protein